MNPYIPVLIWPLAENVHSQFFFKVKHFDVIDLYIFVVPVFADSRTPALSVSGCLCLDVFGRSTALCYANRSI